MEKNRTLHKKEVFLDELEYFSDEQWDEIFDELDGKDTIYTICRENVASVEPRFERVAVLIPIDFNHMTYDREVYSTVVGDGGLVPLPLELVEKLGWREGDELEISETEVCEDGGEYPGICIRKK